VLKVANSAYYRCAGTVGTLERAVQILGTTAIRGIAAVGCMDRIAVPTVGKLFDSRRFRFHSLAVAAAAQSLSRLAGASIDSEAFMAGLLHDIGVVVLARLRPAAAVMLSEMSDLDEEGIRSAEVSLFGVDQVSASARVASQWNLPNWLSGALTPQVAPPTDRPYTGYDALPALLALGHRCAQQAGFGLLVLSAGDPKQDWFVALGLDPAACSAVAEEIPQSLRLLGSA
jgi:HD-like signal output (HDOD) protein